VENAQRSGQQVPGARAQREQGGVWGAELATAFAQLVQWVHAGYDRILESERPGSHVLPYFPQHQGIVLAKDPVQVSCGSKQESGQAEEGVFMGGARPPSGGSCL
jgi:hypothetical protein